MAAISLFTPTIFFALFIIYARKLRPNSAAAFFFTLA